MESEQGLLKERWGRLSTRASRLRAMRAQEDCVHPPPRGLNQPMQLLMDCVERAQREKAARKPGLVRDQRNAPTRLTQTGEGFNAAHNRRELCWRLDVMLRVLIDHPVAITK
jgi:hypothetical protein